jgi:glycyl-tRNA synthetase beta chain/uncharacterized protein
MASMINLDEQRFHSDVLDLLDLPELEGSRQRAHHFDLSEFDHLMGVAKNAHRLSRFARADARVCARAGLLHDLGAHWFNTVAPCALAVRLEEPLGVRHAIKAHTLLPEVPRTREAWVVVAADLLTTSQECRFVIGRARQRAGHRVRTQIDRRHLVLGKFAALRRKLAAN